MVKYQVFRFQISSSNAQTLQLSFRNKTKSKKKKQKFLNNQKHHDLPSIVHDY